MELKACHENLNKAISWQPKLHHCTENVMPLIYSMVIYAIITPCDIFGKLDKGKITITTEKCTTKRILILNLETLS
jgi:hypothetical protein